MRAFRLVVASALLLSLGACASDDEFVPLDTSARDRTAEPTETAASEPDPTSDKPQTSDKKLVRDLAAYVEQNNTSLGKVAIDSIERSPDGFDVRLSSTMAEFGLEQAQALIEQWNQEIVTMLGDAGRGVGDASLRYYLGGQLVAQNKVLEDPWAVEFGGMLARDQ